MPLRKLPIRPPAPSPAPSSPSPLADTLSKSGAPLKRSQSTLTTWLAAVRLKERDAGSRDGGLPDIPGRGVCCGTIEVGAVTDFSHPLARKGIKGQRVTVCVRHREGPP